MKVSIQPVTLQGKIVISNLYRLKNIFEKPALRFTLKTTLPKKYRRGVLGFKLDPYDKGILFIQEGIVSKNAKKKVLEAAEKLVFECEGTLEDVTLEVLPYD